MKREGTKSREEWALCVSSALSLRALRDEFVRKVSRGACGGDGVVGSSVRYFSMLAIFNRNCSGVAAVIVPEE